MVRSYSIDSSDSPYRIYPIRGLLGYFHLLLDASRREAVVIDTGLIGEMSQLARDLKHGRLDWHDIKANLLTHGHIDHTGHLYQINQLTGPPEPTHPLD